MAIPRVRVLLAACLILTGCTGTATDSTGDAQPSGATAPTGAAQTVDYLPGRAADVHRPEPAAATAPVVVLVPGGSWQSADRFGLTPLAEALTAAGAFTVTATYRATDSGGRFPETVGDVVCATRFAVVQARAAGIQPSSVTLVGHSAGGHLAALAVLDGDEFGADCPYPAVPGVALVGLAGVYETSSGMWLPDDFMGAARSEDPQAWARADPVGRLRAGERADDVAALLLHGSADAVVPVDQSEQFESALRDAGAQVRLVVVPDVDHLGIIAPDAVAAAIRDFVESLAASRAP